MQRDHTFIKPKGKAAKRFEELAAQRSDLERVGKKEFDRPETGVRCRLKTIQERQFPE